MLISTTGEPWTILQLPSPPHILSTSLRPDIVAIWPEKKSIYMLELTVPNNSISGLMQARVRKQHKEEYAFLISDLEDREWKVTYNTIEVGSLGHFSQTSNNAIGGFLMTIDPGSIQKIMIKAARVSISCSHQIFLAHKSSLWPSNRPLLN